MVRVVVIIDKTEYGRAGEMAWAHTRWGELRVMRRAGQVDLVRQE